MSAVTAPAAGRSLSQLLLAIDRRTTALASGSAVFMLMLAVGCGLFQVFARFVMQTPSDWTEVLTRFALIWMVYLGVGVALRQGAMVSVDLMLRKMPKRHKRKLEWVIATSVLTMLAVMLVWGSSIAWRIRFQNVAGLDVSMGWAYLAIPVGAAFAVIAVLAHLADPKNQELENAL